MLENEVINIENKNPNSEIESLDDLKQNLIKDITEEKDFKKDNKENESTDQEEKEEVSSNDLLNINDIINNANKENKVKEEKDLNVSSFYSNKSEKNEEIFNSSKFDRESLYNAIKENNSKIDKKKREFNINKKLLRRIMIIIEILFGSLLGSSCILLLIMLIEEKVTHQKIIGVIIEPLILIISFVGMLPISNITYKKIKFALYIWECILLIPLSFYVKSSIDGKYFLFDLIIKIRIGLLAVQIINFVISLIFKIDI